jgi:hypothetical protein
VVSRPGSRSGHLVIAECGLCWDLDTLEGAQLFIAQLRDVHCAPFEAAKPLVFLGRKQPNIRYRGIHTGCRLPCRTVKTSPTNGGGLFGGQLRVTTVNAWPRQDKSKIHRKPIRVPRCCHVSQRGCPIPALSNSVSQVLTPNLLPDILDTPTAVYVAKTMAYSILGLGLKIRVSAVQFHPGPPKKQLEQSNPKTEYRRRVGIATIRSVRSENWLSYAPGTETRKAGRTSMIFDRYPADWSDPQNRVAQMFRELGGGAALTFQV